MSAKLTMPSLLIGLAGIARNAIPLLIITTETRERADPYWVRHLLRLYAAENNAFMDRHQLAGLLFAKNRPEHAVRKKEPPEHAVCKKKDLPTDAVRKIVGQARDVMEAGLTRVFQKVRLRSCRGRSEGSRHQPLAAKTLVKDEQSWAILINPDRLWQPLVAICAGSGTIGSPFFGPEIKEFCPGIRILSAGGPRREWTVLVLYRG